MKTGKFAKKKSQQILATVVMGMNIVNSIAPVAAAVGRMPELVEPAMAIPKSEVKPLEYAVLPQALEFVEI